MTRENNRYPREKPTVRSEGASSGNERILQEHPSYGRISLTHPSGGNVEMFGSDIVHNERISLRIDLAYEETAYGVPTYRSHAGNKGGRVLELEMTAYQWAGLVASHSGNGVPCTLRYITPHGNGPLPLIEGQNSNEEQASIEIRTLLQQMMDNHNQGVEVLKGLYAKGKATKKELGEALALVQNIHNKLPDVTSFALETFQENSEVIVAKGQAEIEASIQQLIVKTGMKALGISSQGSSMLALEDNENGS